MSDIKNVYKEGETEKLSDVFTVKMRVYSVQDAPDPDRKPNKNTSYKDYDAIVDTGADWCAIPQDDIKELGLPLFFNAEADSATGKVKFDYFAGWLEIDGMRVRNLFRPGDIPVIGTKALQWGNFKVNPVEHKLEKIPYLAMNTRVQECAYVVCSNRGRLSRDASVCGGVSDVVVPVTCSTGRPVAIVHNHPSGIPIPSSVDMETARKFNVKMCVKTGKGIRCFRSKDAT